MITQELLDYIKRQKDLGVDGESLNKMLLEAGWQEEDIENALEQGETINSGEPADTSYSTQPVQEFAGATSNMDAVGAPETNSVQPEAESASFGTSGITTGNIQNTPETLTPATPPKKPFLRKFILIVLFLGLIAAAVYGYLQFYYFAPDRVYSKVAAAYENVESFEFTGRVTVRSTNSDTESQTFDGDGIDILSGYFPKDYTVSFSGYAQMPDKTANFKMSIDAAAGILPLVKGDLISVGENLYLNLEEIIDLGAFDLTFLKNQWIRLSMSDLGLAGEDKDDMQDNMLTDEQEKELFEYLQENPPLLFGQKLADTTIEGVGVMRFSFIVNKENLIKFMVKVGELGRADFDASELDNVYEYFEDIEFSEGEIAIGKKDMLIYSIVLPLELKQSSGDTTSVEIAFNFANYNVSQEISEPEDAKTLEEIFGGLFGESGFPEEEPGELEEEDTELDSIQEMFDDREVLDNLNSSTSSTSYFLL